MDVASESEKLIGHGLGSFYLLFLSVYRVRLNY